MGVERKRAEECRNRGERREWAQKGYWGEEKGRVYLRKRRGAYIYGIDLRISTTNFFNKINFFIYIYDKRQRFSNLTESKQLNPIDPSPIRKYNRSL